MEGKYVSESATIMSQRMFPQDANPAGNIHGGVILRYIDLAGATAAMRHCRTSVVTKSIDRMEFRAPALVGELLTFKASVNMAGSTSMEVGVRVEAENLLTGEVRHTASAYLTFVAMSEGGRPTTVPPLLLSTDVEKRRHREASERRETRRRERERELASQGGQG